MNASPPPARSASPFALPEGYGYVLRASNTIMCNIHLQNFTTVAKAVYYQFSMTTRPLAANLIAVRPWWLDIVTCLSSYTVTAGTGNDVRQTDVNVPMRLRVLTAGPHLHCGGTLLELLDRTNNYATIFSWNNTSQQFNFWFRGFPDGFQTLTLGIERGKYYFFQSPAGATIPMN